MSYEYKSKLLGEITQQLAEHWHVPELANKQIYQFAGIHKHTEKHFKQFKFGEKSKNYTMLHIKEAITNPDYVCYNIKNEGFEYHKRFMEYVVVTVKPTEDNPELFCISTIYPSSKRNMEKRIKNENKIIKEIDNMKNDL